MHASAGVSSPVARLQARDLGAALVGSDEAIRLVAHHESAEQVRLRRQVCLHITSKSARCTSTAA